MNECDDYYYFDLIQLMMNNEVINIFPEDNFTNENDKAFICLAVTFIKRVIRIRKRCE